MEEKKKAPTVAEALTNGKDSDSQQNTQENTDILSEKVSEMTEVYNTFFLRPMTMREAEEISGIRRDKITWYVRMMGEKIQLVKTDKCPITRHMAGWYTTNETYWTNKEKQLTFDFWGGVRL